MRTIHKIALYVTDFRRYLLQGNNAKPLHVAIQHGRPCLWVELDTQPPLVGVDPSNVPDQTTIGIVMVGTGYELPPGELEYLGTVLLEQGHLVMHVYWAKP